MRTIIDLPDEQIARLRKLCEDEGISRAEAVRRAVELLLARRSQSEWDRAKAATFGSWKGRGIDALEYERELRDESGR